MTRLTSAARNVGGESHLARPRRVDQAGRVSIETEEDTVEQMKARTADQLVDHAMDGCSEVRAQLRGAFALLCTSGHADRCPELSAARQIVRGAINALGSIHEQIDMACIKLAKSARSEP